MSVHRGSQKGEVGNRGCETNNLEHKMGVRQTRLIGNLSEADLKNMRIFRRVADAGGVTAAAELHGAEKSTYSRSLKALEERLDGALCERGPNGFRLTEYGRRVYSAATSLEDALGNVRTEINGARKRLTGAISLGVADNMLTNPAAKISDALEVFFQRAPAVSVSLSILPPDQLAQALADRKVHLAVIGATNLEPNMTATRLFEEDYALYCCPQPGQHPPHLNTLRSRGVGVVHRNFSGPGPSADSRKITAAWIVLASGLEAVATYINTGRCVGFMPRHYVEGIRTRRPFVEVPGSEHLRRKTEFVVAQETGRTKSHPMILMSDILKSTMQN
ncbi:LysR family transcriptional regulator [Salipiger sp. CCB-MM3]|uniref:LysR family transcriptional regulator n=1 Tax=Salipiger sp. CCB-MM3 TaxID=1792508 RepID=UPI0012FB35EF|nr:LysR family transcriptional regulator [Salipiger sp. CCB-MM3]